MSFLQTQYAYRMADHEALHLGHLDIGQALDIPRSYGNLPGERPEKIGMYKSISARALAAGR